MATLKGTWRFNDVLSKPTWYEQEVNFTYLTSGGTNRNAYLFRYYSGYDNNVEARGFTVRVDGAIIGIYSFATGVWDDYYVSTPFTADFGSTEQEVSADFYTWLTANATPQANEEETEETPIATITYKGETLETINGGEYVTLHTKGQMMEDDIRVEVAEVSGGASGDIAINGIVEQYKVNAGATVNAGDFVEFVNKFGTNTLTNEAIDSINACRLDNHKVFVVYGSTYPPGYGRAFILSFNGAEATVGEILTFNDKGTTIDSITAISDSKVLVTYKSSGIQAIVLSAEGTKIEIGENKTISSNVSTGKSTAISLPNERALVFYWYRFTNSSNSNYAYMYVGLYTISGNLIERKSLVSLNGNSGDDSYEFRATTLSDNMVLLAYVHKDVLTLSTNYYSYYQTIMVTGDVISLGTPLKTSDNAISDGKLIAITEDKALLIRNGSNTASYVLTVNKDGSVVRSSDSFAIDGSIMSVSKLSYGKAIITYKNSNGSGLVTVISRGDYAYSYAPITFYPAEAELSDIVVFSPTSAFVIHKAKGSSGALYTSLIIENSIVIEDGGTFVQPATSRLHNVGVAKTSGTEGQMVDVYCVGGESV